MNPVEEHFAALARDGKKALMPYLTAGFPDMATTGRLIEALPVAGADVIELGIPFSDPIADGPVISSSFQDALAAGVSHEAIFSELARVAGLIDTPILAMVSYSIVYRLHPSDYVRRASDAGLSGLIVPDLPIEEAPELAGLLDKANMAFVPLVAPTTPPDRRSRIAAAATGFVYYQSALGITGERDRLPAELSEGVLTLKKNCNKSVCVGFGISRPEQVRKVVEVADGAIVGSAVVRRIRQAHDEGKDIVESISRFITELAGGLLTADRY